MHLYASFLAPVFIQVALTFALLFTLGPSRAAAVKRGEVKLKDIALGQNAWPDHITQIANSFNNQFQLPVLFYVLALLAMITAKVDFVLIIGAWIFVVSRIAHAYVHVTTNLIRQRFSAYLIGVITLVVMWIWLALRVLLGFSLAGYTL